MENLDGVERLMMSGLRATLVLEKDAQLTEADVKRVLADEKLKFESFAKQVVPRAGAAYVAKTPTFT